MLKYLFPFCHLVLIMSGELQSQTQTVVYLPETGNIINPERGFYHHTETHSDAYSPLVLSQLQSFRNENISLILRVFYLEDFTDTTISGTYLNQVEQDFQTIRQAGLKAVIRFAYTNQTIGWPPASPYGDADKPHILTHIGQLKPILQQNSDVIAGVQAGFIGIWGEWYYTTHFGDPLNGPPTPANIADRAEVLDSLLAVFPSHIQIQTRTPGIKMSTLGITVNDYLDSTQAFNGSSLSRIGHHNDCFLASSHDFGTYGDTTLEKPYLEMDTRFTLMGGETCNPDTNYIQCINSLSELRRFHWTYLNTDYHPDVINGWNTEGCMDEIQQKLGYRLQLVDGTFTTMASQGDGIVVQLSLINTGWAAPVHPKPVILRFVNTSDQTEYQLKLSAYDVRFWLPGDTILIDETIGIGSNVSNGNYQLSIHLPDQDSLLGANPDYAIRLANENTWQSASGDNSLNFTLAIDENHAGGTPYSGDNWIGEPVNTGLKGSLNHQFKVFPNPTTGKIRIIPGEPGMDLTFRLTDMQGRLLFNNPVPGRALSYETNLDHYPEGIYLLQIISKQGNAVYRISKR